MFRCVLAVGLAVSISAQASIYRTDERRYAERGEDTYAATAAVFGQGSQSSAFLISECLAMTVRHRYHGARSIGDRVRLKFPSASGNPKTTAAVVAVGDGRQYWGDWAILRLNECLGTTVGYYQLDSRAISHDEDLVSAGIANDRGAGRVSIDPECHIRGQTIWGAIHDCAALPGNSGGPIIRIDTNGKPKVVGMVVAGNHDRRPREFSDEGANLALPAISLIHAFQTVKESSNYGGSR